MKFKINRDHFGSGLQQVLNVVGSRVTMPILGNVLIEAEGEAVFLTTTNLDLGIRCSIKASILEPGAVTLPVRTLATIVRELPSLEVVFETTGTHQAKISSGGSKFRLMGLGKEEFPQLPTFSKDRSFAIRQEMLGEMLRSVSYAQSTDEARFILNGVFFQFKEGKLSLVATDGRRLAFISRELEFPPEQTGQVIIPAKTAGELMRLLDQGEEVRISFSENQIAFDVDTERDEKGLVGGVYLVSKIVEGTFPNYNQVIPKETHLRVKLERELFLQCVHRAALVVSDKGGSVRLGLSENLMEISASSPELGESHESMDIEYSGPSVKVAFNPQFVMDPLRALTKDEVFFEFKDEFSPGVFKTLESFLCVIMPLRLN